MIKCIAYSNFVDRTHESRSLFHLSHFIIKCEALVAFSEVKEVRIQRWLYGQNLCGRKRKLIHIIHELSLSLMYHQQQNK